MTKNYLYRFIFTVLLLSFILIAETILHKMHLPTWPPFFVMLFFFLHHEDKEQIPKIIIGALVGISCFVIARPIVRMLAPFMNPEMGRTLFVLGIVAAIIWLKEDVPRVINDYTFAFLLLSGIAARWPEYTPVAPYIWMADTLVFGLLFIFAIMGIRKTVVFIATKRERAALLRERTGNSTANRGASMEKNIGNAVGNDDLAGTWDLTVVLPTGSGNPSVTLKQEGAAIAGMYSGRYGDAPVQGTIQGNDFVISLEYRGSTIGYRGKIEGSRMAGSVEGNNRSGTFTGKKR